jgi:tetratricopeptide (TPR) repeat protein
MEVGQNLKLRIFFNSDLESKRIETDVQVAWKGIDLEGSGYRMGVRFVNISSSSALLVLAKRLHYLGEWSDEYDKKIDPELAMAYRILGRICMYKDDYNHAILFFKKSIELHPDNGAAYLYRGFTYYRKGVYEKSWGIF